MTTHITVLNIKHKETAEQLELMVTVDGTPRCYPTKIFDLDGSKGVSISDRDELSDVLCRDRQKTRKFMNLILSVYKGHHEQFPIDFEF